MAHKRAIVLLSGGLDSVTALYVARAEGVECMALSFLYGQRHTKELDCARTITHVLGLPHEIITIDLPWKGSSLLDEERSLPCDRNDAALSSEIPSTYVPGRNTIFLSFALSYAEAIKATTIIIGANAIDYSGYPDCRPAYYDAWGALIKQGTKIGVEGGTIAIHTPLINLSKEQIIRLGRAHQVPYELTWSCYAGGVAPCGHCDACQLRAKGFAAAGVEDPLIKEQT